MSDTTDAIDTAVNTGKTAWDIVMDGKAATSAKSAFCSAIPTGVKDNELSGWKSTANTWPLKVKNAYGVDVIDAEFAYRFNHSGVTEKSPGSVYMTNFTVYAKKVEVLWGWSLDVSATVKGKPINIGSAKKQIWAVPLQVNIKYGSPLKVTNSGFIMVAVGNGALKVQ